MALPPQFKRGGDGPPREPGVSVEQALDALEDKAQSPRARAALNTLRSELSGDEGGRTNKRSEASDRKEQALARLRA